MKKTPQLIGLSVLLALQLAMLPGCSKSTNANDSASGASNKFIGTWKVASDSEADFKGGPVTFKDDNTYSAQKTTDPSSAVLTGPYTIKDGKLYLGGELAKFGEEGMSVETDGRLKLTKGGKTIYFVKS
jgi:hypothetical protein